MGKTGAVFLGFNYFLDKKFLQSQAINLFETGAPRRDAERWDDVIGVRWFLQKSAGGKVAFSGLWYVEMKQKGRAGNRDG